MRTNFEDDPNLWTEKTTHALLRWCYPPLICGLCFGFQSVMLHMTTAKYVNLEHFHLQPAADVGHMALGNQKVNMTVLDAISGMAFLLVFVGTLLLRDLRLWVRLFFSNAILFVLKGVFDWMTVFPDSIGWKECDKRLSVNGTNPNVLPFMKKLGQLDGMDYLGKLMELEIHGVEFKNLTSGKAVTTWPVRYCADMLLSGHTFVLVLYMLAFADLMRRITIMMSPVPRAVCRILIGLFCMACVGADLFLIVRNQFHYTVDVVMAIIMTVLVYTNVGMTAVVQWYAQEVDRRGKPIVDNGITWVPALMVPFCCFNGYYSVQEMEEQQVLDEQAGNDSGVWRWLTSLFEPEASISPDQVQSYGSTENAEQKSEAKEEA
mmetsp:Transcript_112414/g.157613  ORF Transcript_112414/g.157613 Transcript_112414/m.157613 type:complete len:376 (+) Transcript_112414:88-1215(+)